MALKLSHTTIAAPVDGTIGARSLRVGQFAQAGTQLVQSSRSMRSMSWRISRKLN
jgi:multidrug resistance efflux pump